MRSLGASGVFELFVPGVRADALYKYEIETASRRAAPEGRSVRFRMRASAGERVAVVAVDLRVAGRRWMAARRTRIRCARRWRSTRSISGPWRASADGVAARLREIAEPLLDHVFGLGFTHLELLPITEHPFDGSWGYQVSGYYAPTARYGDRTTSATWWISAIRTASACCSTGCRRTFPRDDFALRRFDGTALYEHDDPRIGEHPDWGTLIFNYGRHEVRNFLIANALFWLHEYHIDGLRVDAVASMLYRDYSREEGEWIPNYARAVGRTSRRWTSCAR